ncbi:DUF2182 domain-containing protein [Segnochrobactraceae bacterium EtOH-i3]
MPASAAGSPPRPRALDRAALGLVGVIAALGWVALVAMVIGMPAEGLAALGPGMDVFGALDLPPSVAAGLATLCAPLGGAAGLLSPAGFALAFLMWMAMSAAMMLPSAAPVLAIRGHGPGEAGARILGYLGVWFAFSLLATAVQAGLVAAGQLSSALAPAGVGLAGLALVAAGLYQFTPLKTACLIRCRFPPVFAPRTTGRVGAAFRDGLGRGMDCLGCCWVMMAAMLALGTMNLVWMAVLGVLAALEKLTTGRVVPTLIGLALTVLGAALLMVSPFGAALLAGV